MNEAGKNREREKKKQEENNIKRIIKNDVENGILHTLQMLVHRDTRFFFIFQ